MFARQGFGNPFQPTINNPFSLFTGGMNPFTTGTGFGGVNPMISPAGGFGVNPFSFGQTTGFNPITSFLTPQFGTGTGTTINPMVFAQLAATNPMLVPFLSQQTGSGFGAFGGVTPFTQPFGGINAFSGFNPNPFTGVPTTGFGTVNPFLANLFGTGTGTTINPMVFAQLAATNPMLLPLLSQQTWGNFGSFGSVPNTGVFGSTNPLFCGVGQFGTQPFTSQFGFGGTGSGNIPFNTVPTPFTQSTAGMINPQVWASICANPALACDPTIGTLLAQQLNQGQPLPIRSLINNQQFEPFQSATTGITGQWTDPLQASVLNQVGSPLAANLSQHLYKGFGLPGTTGFGLTGNFGQPFSAQACAPFCG
jgi:hypothetical protein